MLHCAQGFKEHQVRVEISSRYRRCISVQKLRRRPGWGVCSSYFLCVCILCRFNRRSVPEMEKHIEGVWNERVTKEPWLFNGAKFRLHSAELSSAPLLTSANFCTNAVQTLKSTGNEQLENDSVLNRTYEGGSVFFFFSDRKTNLVG